MALEISEDEYIQHYGIIRRSGRYPWGSTNNVSGQEEDIGASEFLKRVNDLLKQMTPAKAAEWLGMTTTELRARKRIAQAESKVEDEAMVRRLRAKGVSLQEIADRMGYKGESNVRAILKEDALQREKRLIGTVDMLKDELKKNPDQPFIDMGEGVPTSLNMSRENLDAALVKMESEGWGVVISYRSPQVLNPQNDTKRRALCPPDTTWADVMNNPQKRRQLAVVTPDGGETYQPTWKRAIPLDPKRVRVVYAEDGGAEADGVLYVRPGVPDLTLGPKNYAQVRVQVGDGHYMKGMAVLKDDMPDGVDILYNTPKKRSDVDSDFDVFKELKDDPELPFGSVVRNIRDSDGPDWEPKSVMNLVNDEGDWAKWSKSISSQMLVKQNPKLIREQLDLTMERRKAELDEIMALTNPTLKKKLLQEFADKTDKAAVDLKSAQLERSAWHVILPVNTLKPNEIYAPGYNHGEEVALIRYPHAGPFEIPLLTVNNNHRPAKKIIGNRSKDAVAIHHSVAELLSGADFDGDTVLVIPNDKRTNKVKTRPPLPGLVNFDPKVDYKASVKLKADGTPDLDKDGNKQYNHPIMGETAKQHQMGVVSNLITDMQLQGASDDEMTRAVKHSMTVIDAAKHKLNYKLSYQENGIHALKQKYQAPDPVTGQGGAATLISRARRDKTIPKQKPRPHALGGPIDPKTGKKVFVPTNEVYTNKKGEVIVKTQRVPALSDTDDAYTLTSKGRSSPTAEKLYAEQSNRLKAMANEARLLARDVPKPTRNPSASKTYADEVQSLRAKMDQYDRNKPRERDANDIASAYVKERIRRNPELKLKQNKAKLQKVRQQSQRKARHATGVARLDFTFTDREWEAIQAGAISDQMLANILKRADPEHVRMRATPKTTKLLDNVRADRAQSMLDSGMTRADVAAALGVSLSTLDRATGDG